MAKKKQTVEKVDSPIVTERTDWGVQLKIHPFRGIHNAGGSDAMVIHADVSRPQKGRKAEIRYWFNGVTGKSNLSHSELTLWTSSLRSLIDEAQRVGQTLRPPRAIAM